jgi:small subunit ribosomal protein S17
MRKTKIGRVVSDRMAKTIVVKVEEWHVHPRYHKHIRKHAKFHSHDESGLASVGDLVKIEECRPRSQKKRWRLLEVIEKVEA